MKNSLNEISVTISAFAFDKNGSFIQKVENNQKLIFKTDDSVNNKKVSLKLIGLVNAPEIEILINNEELVRVLQFLTRDESRTLIETGCIVENLVVITPNPHHITNTGAQSAIADAIKQSVGDLLFNEQKKRAKPPKPLLLLLLITLLTSCNTTSVFVWTLDDIICLSLLAFVLLVSICGFIYNFLSNLFKSKSKN